ALVTYAVMHDGRRFVNAPEAGVQHPQEELVILACSQRAFEFPEVDAKSADVADHAPAHGHIRADGHNTVFARLDVEPGVAVLGHRNHAVYRGREPVWRGRLPGRTYTTRDEIGAGLRECLREPRQPVWFRPNIIVGERDEVAVGERQCLVDRGGLPRLRYEQVAHERRAAPAGGFRDDT